MLEKIKKISIQTLTGSLTLLAFCFLSIAVQAQTIPSEIFGEYNGEVRIRNTTFSLDETMPISVLLEKTGGANDYVLKMANLEIIDIKIPVEMDNIIITPISGGYRLSRSTPLTFTIDEVYIPAIPPLYPGGMAYNVPVRVTLGNSQIVNFVLDLNLEVVATISIYGYPMPVTFSMVFKGMLLSAPVITTTKLPSGIVNKAYSTTFAANGTPPITWSIIDGTLPTGLTLTASTGAISGTPTQSGIFSFTVRAANASGNDMQVLSLRIDMDTLGISTTEIAGLNVYPNPTTGELRITNYELQIKSIEVYDVFGKKLLSHHLISSSSNHLINISHLPEGTYLLKIQTEQGVRTQKIIKQ